MPRFVLLRHECPPQFEKPSHWDLMLECEGVLRTWDLRELPTAWAAVLSENSGLGENSSAALVTAYPLADHRLAYLDYEGPLTGERGTVRCCDRGELELLEEGEHRLTALLSGDLLQGKIRLMRLGQEWSLETV